MIVITDANIILSALYDNNSLISSILKDKNLQFIAPSYLKTEVKKHWDKIEKSSRVNPKEIKAEWVILQKIIKFIDTETIADNIVKKSLDIVKDIDEFDLFFVALHFQTGHKIWTGDKQLIKGIREKGYDIFITTQQLKNYMYKKN